MRNESGKAVWVAIFALLIGFFSGRSCVREKPTPVELKAGTELTVSYPVAAMKPAQDGQLPVYANQKLRVFRHDTPGAAQWKETAWRVRIGPHELVAAPE